MKHQIPDAILRSHSAFLGKTGSGKTSLEKLVVEQVVADGARVCVLDTLKSDWWGITSSASGKSAGLPFKILGGPRGHVPLHSSAGKVIGQLVGTGKLPLSIVDMADFEPGGIQRFFVDFAQALWRSARGVVYLVIEEAQEIAPKERAGFGAENMAIHWAKKLATGSRTKGIRLMVATQRVQALHNAVLGSCETLFAMRLTTPADKDPVIGWLKDNADKETIERVRSTLSSLPTGTGWICSGEAGIFEQRVFPKFRTFDNTATPEGDGDQFDVKTASVDQEELRALIGEEAAKAEANDPAKLKAQIATLTADKVRLERQAQAPGVDDPQKIADAERRGFMRGFDDGVFQAASYAAQVKAKVDDAYASIGAMADRINAIGEIEPKFVARDDTPSGSLRTPAKAATTPKPAPAASPAPPARQPSPAASGDGSNSKAMTKALTTMVELSSLGVDAPKREMIAAMANYANIKSRPIREAFAQMLSFGWATSGEAGRLTLTEVGRSQVTIPPMPLTAREMRDRIAAVLGHPADKVLDMLVSVYPASETREALAAAANYANIKSRPIREAFSKLLDMGFVTAPSAGQLKAGEALFP